MNPVFNCQELFMYDGTMVFIIEHIDDNNVKIGYYDQDETDIVDPDDLISATPEELEEAGI